MTGLALWLAAIALVDVARSGRQLRRAREIVALAVPATALLVLAAGVADPTGWGVVAWLIAAFGAVAWVVGSAEGWAPAPVSPPAPPASSGPSSSGPSPSGRWRSRCAFLGLGAGIVALAAAGDRAGAVGGLDALVRGSVLGADARPAHLLLVAAVLLAQLGTANLVVRLLLQRVGVPVPDTEKRLRGGRFLGPMERLLIVGLGLGGSLEGAAVVVAAKALLRFPEVREAASRGEAGGPSDVTEYFLVGSFASWIVAFASLGLAAL